MKLLILVYFYGSHPSLTDLVYNLLYLRNLFLLKGKNKLPDST